MKMKNVIAFVIILFFALTLGRTQSIPTGKLNGQVTDENGVPLPGAAVSISSPALILPEMAVVTSENGQFKFFSLPSGKYTVKFELDMFKTIIREGIVISANHTTTLYVEMQQGSLEETLTVIGQAPIVDLQKTQTGTNFTKELLDDLPLQRDLSSVFNAAPGMFARTSHGSDARSNNFVVDGVKMQDPVTGDPYQTVPWNAIDEVEIETSNQKAEYGAVKGALVQVITKAGGNDFSGSLNFYFRNKDLQSDNTKGTDLEGSFVGFDWQYLPGFSMGGPIKKDKVWFFTSFDVDKSQSYIQGFPAPETLGGSKPESEPTKKDTYAPFGKLTWQINPQNKLVASGYFRQYNWDHRNASRWTSVDANAKEDSAVWLGTAQWTRFFSDNLFLNLKSSWYSLHQYILARNDLAPYIELTDGILRGGMGSDWWYTRRRFQANGDMTYFVDGWLGSHEFKGGISFEYARDTVEDKYYQDSHFEGIFPTGFKAVDIQLWEGVPQWAWVGTEYKQKNDLIQLGAFFQDTWAPTKHLTINLGIRYDHAQGSYPPQRSLGTSEWVNEERITAMTFNMVSPRLGLSYDPIGDGRTVLRANVGRYYAPLLMIYYYFNNPNQRTSFWARLNPDWTVAYTTPPWTPGLNAVDEDISSPYADEINIGVEREIIEDFSVAATFIAKWEKNIMDDVDAAHVDIEKFKETGEMDWSGYHQVQGTDPFTGQPITYYEMNTDFGDFNYLYMNIPGSARKYTGVELKLTKRMSHNWGMQASYVWGRGKGILNTSRDQSTGFSGYYDNPNVMINAYGLLDYQREHLVKIQGSYQAPLGINIGIYYQFGSGVPYTRELRSYEAGLGALYQGGVTIFTEERGSQRLPDQHLLDIRIEKAFNIGKGQLALQLDGYNVFNNNQATSIGSTTNFDWFQDQRGQEVYSIMGPRYVQLGVVYRF
ncbi:MAG: TonB-dependent receptor [Candidatus Aminicenantes bacterium]|nr:TonB-dependent receptor [Candidatus Aminicenantes bacterium]